MGVGAVVVGQNMWKDSAYLLYAVGAQRYRLDVGLDILG